MSTDRELLELAARAAGLSVLAFDHDTGSQGSGRSKEAEMLKARSEWWARRYQS